MPLQVSLHPCRIHACASTPGIAPHSHIHKGAYDTLFCTVSFSSLIRGGRSAPICTYRVTTFQSPTGHLGGSPSFATTKLATLRHSKELAHFLPPHPRQYHTSTLAITSPHRILFLSLSPSLLGVFAFAVPLPEMLFCWFFANGLLFPFLGSSSNHLPQWCALIAPSTMAGAVTQLPVSSLSLLLPFIALFPIKLSGLTVYVCVVQL